MKLLSLSIIFITSLSLTAQDSVTGRYRTYFGDRLQLNTDGSFKYTWHFDMIKSWTKGTWTINHDTVLLHMIPMYDTIQKTNDGRSTYDSLIFSADEIPERIIPPRGGQIVYPLVEIIDQPATDKHINSWLNACDQNGHDYPDKLVFKKGRLYTISNGRLVVKKQKGFWTKKKWSPWYFKSDE